MLLNKRLEAELDRRAVAQNTTRARLVGNMLWALVFPGEPTPEEQREISRRAAQETKLAQFQAAAVAWQDAQNTREIEKQAERKVASRQANRAARWEQKFEAAKARWHEKYGDMPSQNIP